MLTPHDGRRKHYHYFCFVYLLFCNLMHKFTRCTRINTTTTTTTTTNMIFERFCEACQASNNKCVKNLHKSLCGIDMGKYIIKYIYHEILLLLLTCN